MSLTVRSMLLPFVLLGFIAVPASATPIVYDLGSDWSDTANGGAGNPWSYRAGNTLLPADPNWTPLTAPYTQPSWSNGNTIPAWFKSQGNPGFLFAPTDIQSGDVVTHTTTDPSNQSNVLFTTPTAGVATISGFLFNSRQFNRPQDWELLVNGVVEAFGSLPGDGSVNRGSRDTFNLSSISLTAGEQVELLISPVGGVGDFVTTDVTVTLAATPEPTTLGLLGTSLVGLALGRLRRRRESRSGNR